MKARRLDDPGALEALRHRLGRLRPETPAQWGRMNAPEMVCHLADAFRWSLGDRAGSAARLPIPAPLARLVALRLPLPWPRGAPTMPEMDQRAGGTPPGDFREDMEALLDLMERFVAFQGEWPRHPVFGFMSREDWGRWGYRHTDHHLRQFGA